MNTNYTHVEPKTEKKDLWLHRVSLSVLENYIKIMFYKTDAHNQIAL